MRASDIPRLRMRNLRLHGEPLESVQETVAWHGAIQAQDYVPAQWSLAQRTLSLTPADVDQAIADGSIVRTHALRPTWHLLAREDARFVLELTGPRIRRGMQSRHRELGLDARTLARAERVILKSLAGGRQATRKELGEALVKGGVDVSGQRLPHLLMHCELILAISSGARRGKDHTYAVFDERVPSAKKLTDEEAIMLLVERYLRSHGPASVADVQWWAGLKSSDIRAALADLGSRVHSKNIGGLELWWFDPEIEPRRPDPGMRLLETYDEYIVGYTRSRFLGDPQARVAIDSWRGRAGFGNLLTRRGKVFAGWRRTKTENAMTVEATAYGSISKSDDTALRRETERFATFYGLTPTLTFVATPIKR